MYARRLGQHPVEIEQYRVVVSRGECGDDFHLNCKTQNAADWARDH
jgi:hypothetical protein